MRELTLIGKVDTSNLGHIFCLITKPSIFGCAFLFARFLVIGFKPQKGSQKIEHPFNWSPQIEETSHLKSRLRVYGKVTENLIKPLLDKFPCFGEPDFKGCALSAYPYERGVIINYLHCGGRNDLLT